MNCSRCKIELTNSWCLGCGGYEGEMEELKCHHGFEFSKPCISANCDAINHKGPKYKLIPKEKKK